MTTVISKLGWLASSVLLVAALTAQSPTQNTLPSATGPAAKAPAQPPSQPNGPAESLYLQLSTVGLDASRVYRVQDLSLDRAPIHLSFDTGTIAFTADVAGRVTGAFFEGEGEILLIPPNKIERSSMALFTGSAILEEQFVNAYLRFNDETFAEMQPYLRPADHAQEFVAQWNAAAQNLAESDALRLLMSFCQSLPTDGRPATTIAPAPDDDRMLHLHVQGSTLGAFEVYFDASASEQVRVAQFKTVDAVTYYDDWTSFALPQSKKQLPHEVDLGAETVKISSYAIHTQIKPPTELDADAVLQVQAERGGQRALLFELSQFLDVRQVSADGHPVEFIHNQALEGTHLARRGNDLLAVIFPEPLRSGQQVRLEFVYGGTVLSDAGAGLLYVGARGMWYPNRGFSLANYDLEFRYPVGWTLLATGKNLSEGPAPAEPTSPGQPSREIVSRWVSDRPIPIAGFNLGRYERAMARAGNVAVETYASQGVEKKFPKPRPEGPVISSTPTPFNVPQLPTLVPPEPPSPARNAEAVATQAAHAVDFYSSRFGPYPYGQLVLTQLPGLESQGWPGLVFLSSYSFLTPDEKSDLHMSAVQKAISAHIVAHEIAHQWWGDLVNWSGYRDQWMMEALADYSSLLILQSEDPPQFHAILEKYRDDLLQQNKAGTPLLEDGPVTLGQRLACSEFPNGYTAISYGRGTWLLHMLRYMLRDAEPRTAAGPDSEEPFIRGLRRVRERYEGKTMTVSDLLKVFEEDLPPSLRYEGRKSLDWFFQGWINGTAVPRFELRGVKYVDKPGSTSVSGTILQKDAPEDLVTPVPLYAVRAGKLTLAGRIFADGPETHFHLSAPLGTRKIVIDPNHTLLARTQ